MRKSIQPVQYWDATNLRALPEAATQTMLMYPHSGVVALPSEWVLLPGSPQPFFDLARWWHCAALGMTHDVYESGESHMPHCLLEHFEDCGSDGHVEYQRVGYALLTDALLREYVDAARVATDRYEFPIIEQD
jgi:hypothetical protein